MPSQSCGSELFSVDSWYKTGNSAPTDTEVLLCTLLIELVVGHDREAFMRAVEAEMTANRVPQGGGEGVWRASKTFIHNKGVVGRCLGLAMSNYSKDTVQPIAKLPRSWETGRGVALRKHPHLYIVPRGRQAAGACPCGHKVLSSKESRPSVSKDRHDDESQR